MGLKEPIRSISLTIEYTKASADQTFTAVRHGSGKSDSFFIAFFKKVFKQIMGRELPDAADGEQTRYKRLMSQKVALDIARKENTFVEFEQVLMFIQAANTVFANELNHAKRDILLWCQDEKVKTFVKGRFKRLGDLYSKQDFIDRIFTDAEMAQRENKKNIS